MKTSTRIVLSAVVMAGWSWLSFGLNSVATLGSAEVAGKQFENSDLAYVASTSGMRLFSWLPLLAAVACLAATYFIWRGVFSQPAAQYDRKDPPPIKTGLIAIAVLSGLAALSYSGRAMAYYDKTNWAEVAFILPNESAFWIPDTGANLNTQAKLNSEEYFNANKIAAKRFSIPHVQLSNSGAWNDYYVPSGRLIIVDRTPYNREWVKAADRGTSTKNESFPCQTSEGINVTVGMAIGSSVTEENAAKFLYYFGVNPPSGERTNPAVVFTSIYYGRTLKEIMDTVVRGKIQTMVCSAIGNRTLNETNEQATKILNEVQSGAVSYMNAHGIDLDYLGWADTFEFDNDVQQAINDNWTAKEIEPVLPVLRTKVLLDATEKASTKWNGSLPTSVSGFWLLPSEVMDAIVNWFKPPAAPVAKVAISPASSGPAAK
jgi:hypothetical protein